jgi:hypothetical protein
MARCREDEGLSMDRASATHWGPPEDRLGPKYWWESRLFVAALILLSMVPLLLPQVPPLVDLLGHMGRYRVQLDLNNSAFLPRYYGFEWAPIGNLGVDLLLEPLGRLLGLELAVKLITLAIPPLTVAGFLWVAREVHHRLPPTALFALPFAYAHPFMFGFVNYALSIALAFLAFGLWLRLARQGRFRLRAALFVPISFIVFFAHTFGWGVLGLMCFSAEAVRQHDTGETWLGSVLKAAAQASLLALPLFALALWRSDIEGGLTTGWFKPQLKLAFFKAVLRDRWEWFDIGSLVVCLLVIVETVRRKTMAFSRNLAFSALVLFLVFLAMPYVVFRSAYADMRLIPYVLAVALLAIRFREPLPMRTAHWFAVAGLLFFVVRIAGNSWSLAATDRDYRAKLEALDHVPAGARVLSLVGDGCGNPWTMPRNTHLGAMVIVRRHGFSNDQWVTEGMNLLKLRYRGAGPFTSDPSQIVRADNCVTFRGWKIHERLAAIPPGGFDYLWLIETPPFDPALLRGAQPVWSGPGTMLYRLPQGG